MRQRIGCYFIRFILSVLVGFVHLSAPGQLRAQSDAPPAHSVLLTEEEAEQLRLTGEEWLQPVRGRQPRSQGPSIVFQSPSITSVRANPPTITTVTPLNLFVTFEPNPAPIDMASLKVQAKKGLLRKSLIDRLRPFIAGTTIRAEDLEIPTGKFYIEIEIADSDGQKTLREYYLQVSE